MAHYSFHVIFFFGKKTSISNLEKPSPGLTCILAPFLWLAIDSWSSWCSKGKLLGSGLQFPYLETKIADPPKWHTVGDKCSERLYFKNCLTSFRIFLAESFRNVYIYIYIASLSRHTPQAIEVRTMRKQNLGKHQPDQPGPVEYGNPPEATSAHQVPLEVSCLSWFKGFCFLALKAQNSPT